MWFYFTQLCFLHIKYISYVCALAINLSISLLHRKWTMRGLKHVASYLVHEKYVCENIFVMILYAYCVYYQTRNTKKSCSFMTETWLTCLLGYSMHTCGRSFAFWNYTYLFPYSSLVKTLYFRRYFLWFSFERGKPYFTLRSYSNS